MNASSLASASFSGRGFGAGSAGAGKATDVIALSQAGDKVTLEMLFWLK